MHCSLLAVFDEDRAGLEAIEEMVEACAEDFHEISVVSDRANLAMRRFLKRRAEGNARPAVQAARV